MKSCISQAGTRSPRRSARRSSLCNRGVFERHDPSQDFPSASDNAARRRLWQLDSQELCAEARQRTGLDNFGDAEIETRLSVLVNSIESEANLHLAGRFLARMHLRGLLETRLALEGLLARRHTSEIIERPIFITGMPRSGSTFLQELLSLDPGNRTPCVWECMFPVAAVQDDERQIKRSILKTRNRLWWFRRLAQDAKSICPIRATGPHECVGIHSYTLLSHEFVIMFRVPTYKAFLAAADLRPAYEWQKQFLQRLQARDSARRWVLKSPDHVFGLDALFEVFPDALIIQTHREPLEVLRSCVRMSAALQRTFARKEAIERVSVREGQALSEAMERITGFRETHPELADRFFDVHYRELISNPLATMKRLYAQLGLPLSSIMADRVQTLARNRSRYPKRVEHTLSQLGLDAQEENQRFQRYSLRFGVH